ncbi:MAG: RsmD family RNA methyltransferase [Flavobacteriaceae bacterium]
MRIISGKYKGRRITAPKNLPIRPTTDLAKESLFNILNNFYHFDELKVLDLFSGSGNISYEFASRGSEDITSVDTDFGCVRFIKQTSDAFDFSINAIKSDVFSFLEKTKSEYDVIFADPPYGFTQEQFEKIPKLIFENALLAEDGMLIIEHSTHTHIEDIECFSHSKKYGSSVFSFFIKEEEL